MTDSVIAAYCSGRVRAVPLIFQLLVRVGVFGVFGVFGVYGGITWFVRREGVSGSGYFEEIPHSRINKRTVSHETADFPKYDEGIITPGSSSEHYMLTRS